jgi:hypothetical protein
MSTTDNKEEGKIKFNPEAAKASEQKEKLVTVPEDLLIKLKSLVDSKESEINALKNKEGESTTAELIRQLKQVVEQSAPKSKLFGMSENPVSLENIDPDDVLSTPAIFFSYTVSTRVWDDVRHGRTIKPPYGVVIKFHNTERTVEKLSSFEMKYTNTCHAIIWSKKQADFIRNHSLFGIKYFEYKSQSKLVTSQEQEFIQAAWQQVHSLSDNQVVNMLLSHGSAPKSTDARQSRYALVEILKNRLMEDAKNLRNKQIRDFEESMSIMKDGKSSSQVPGIA